MFTPAQIAELITEDPDVILEWDPDAERIRQQASQDRTGPSKPQAPQPARRMPSSRQLNLQVNSLASVQAHARGNEVFVTPSGSHAIVLFTTPGALNAFVMKLPTDRGVSTYTAKGQSDDVKNHGMWIAAVDLKASLAKTSG